MTRKLPKAVEAIRHKPTFRDLRVQQQEELMGAAEKRELRKLSLNYIYYQPLPMQLRSDRPALDSMIEACKQDLILSVLGKEAIILRGVEHALVRKFDVRDWPFNEYKGMMILMMFGWAYPDDNPELKSGG